MILRMNNFLTFQGTAGLFTSTILENDAESENKPAKSSG